MYRNISTAGDTGNGDGDDFMIEIPSKQDLVDLLPQLFQNILEYPEIMKAWAKGLDMAGGSSRQVWDNLYIQTCDLETLEEYEAYLGINPSPDDTLTVRRARVMSRLMVSVPYSERKIRVLLDEMYGAGNYTLTVDSEHSEAQMEIHKSIEQGMLLFCALWFEMAPAHMAFTVNEDITTDIDSNLYFGGCITQTQYTNIA